MEILLISIVIPVFKTEKYIAKCLDSVLSQTYNNLEVIVVDDGSPDDAFKIVNKYAEKDNRIKLIRQANQGLSAARNTGICNSNGYYILFLDSDDYLTLNALEGLINVAERTKADIVIPIRYISVMESTGSSTLKFHFEEREQILDPIVFAKKVLIGKGRAWRASALLYKRIILIKYNIHFPVGYTQEDVIFNLDYFSRVKNIAFYNHPTLYNLKRKGSITTSYNEKLIDNFLFIDKKVEDFLVQNKINNADGQKNRDSLLCRNTIIFLTSLFSYTSNETIRGKLKRANAIILNDRIRASFQRESKELPYFNSKMAVIYFQIMFFLLKNGFNFSAFLLATIGSLFFVKT